MPGHHKSSSGIQPQGLCQEKKDSLFVIAFYLVNGFDSKSFRNALGEHGIIANVCPNPRNAEPKEDYIFDEELYKERSVIERSNAWMGGSRSLMTRFDTNFPSW